MNILLLRGGNSTEREVSLRSGQNVLESLQALGHQVTLADPSDNDFNLANLTSGQDCVFPILHGQGGEDGSIQASLENLGVKYLGSNSQVSKMMFNKEDFKYFLVNNNFPTPEFEIVDKENIINSRLIQKPYVLKPIEGGSSIDVFISRNDLKISDEMQEALSRYDQMLLEELIDGQEYTVGILGDLALPIIGILPPEGKEFDYENKYNGQTQEIVDPSFLSDDLKNQLKVMALSIHQKAGGRDISRTDFMISDGQIFVLETNSIPGMTSQSLLPKACQHINIEFQNLVAKMLELTLTH